MFMSEKKKGTIRVKESTKKMFKKIRKKHLYTVGKTDEEMMNHILKRIIAGSYFWMAGKRNRNVAKIYADYDLVQKASEQAKKQGYSSLNEFLNEIIRAEYKSHVYKRDKGSRLFETVGRRESSELQKMMKKEEENQRKAEIESGMY
ncbi:hypothetical protein ACFY6E_12470 [Staphylococcus cohnii]|uniref:hypothetical protein n=1 Tax=Staphylococcus cohnii TaxID=29382 RepID=UPI0036752C0E